MFDLEQTITKWKQQMVAGGIRNPAVLDELESHLREETERQTRAGVPVERAFDIAAQKIGPANALKNEFRKNGFASLAEKLMIAAATLAIAFGIFLTSVTILFCYDRLGERVVGFAALGLILAAVFGLSHAAPLLPAIFPERKRVALQLACLLTGFGICTFYLQVILPHFGRRPDGMLPAIGFWGLIPIAIGIGLVCALEKAARVTRHTNQRVTN